jgi:hypothetical protein
MMQGHHMKHAWLVAALTFALGAPVLPAVAAVSTVGPDSLGTGQQAPRAARADAVATAADPSFEIADVARGPVAGKRHTTHHSRDAAEK